MDSTKKLDSWRLSIGLQQLWKRKSLLGVNKLGEPCSGTGKQSGRLPSLYQTINYHNMVFFRSNDNQFSCTADNLLDFFNRVFLQIHKLVNIGINANFVFPYIHSFLLYLYHMMLVDVKLNVSGYKLIPYQCRILHWSCSFPIAQL